MHKIIIIINFMYLGKAKWGSSPPPSQGERPKFYSWSDICIVMKVHKSVKRRAKPEVRPKKFATQINTRDFVKLNKHWRVVQ